MFGFLAACAYVLTTGDFPGFEVMGVQEDSAIVGVLLDLHRAVSA
jgi:hypothetical protein